MMRFLYRILGVNAQGRANPIYSFRMQWPDFLYIEGNRKALIRGEMMTGDVDFVIYAGDIKNWLPPHDDEMIGEAKKTEIVSRLQKWLVGQKIRYEIDDS